MKLIVGNDIGNSVTKMYVGEKLIKQPSVIKRLFVKPDVTETDVKTNVTNLLDEMIVNVTSGAIKRNGLYFVGTRANITADKVENMNIRLGGKHKHDIPIIMTLSMIAAQSIKTSFGANGRLPAEMSLTVGMTSAIPASEYSQEKARTLEGRFTSGTHVVVVYVGDQLVTVKITFDQVKVTQEGVPALYALIEAKPEILEIFKETYKEVASFTVKDFRGKNILHVDIGDGTTEYIYMKGMNPINDACSGERRGVGHATEEAIKMLKEHQNGHLNINRQQFMEIYKDPTHNLHEDAVRFMEEARYIEAQKIVEDVKERYMTYTAGNVDYIMVYGGGSIQFFEELFEELREFADEVHCKLLYIPAKFAVNMNARGMKVLNEKVIFKKTS